jgi:tetratricopeptide (TPR) repeat protein
MPQSEPARLSESAMKVFLSHSTRDRGFVDKLAAAMSVAGFNPWLGEIDIESGTNFVAEISKGLKGSDLLLLVWSPDAARSAWTEQEWTSALKQEVEESRIRLGLIMLRQCDRPPLLDTKNYIDATRDHDLAIQATIDWLRLRESACRFSLRKGPLRLERRPPTFVGRSAYLHRLHKIFTGEPTAFLLYGEPGSGKSDLALQFAWEAQKDFDVVVHQRCGQRTLDIVTSDLARALPIDAHQAPVEQQRTAVKQWLSERQSLLILDDVWSADMTMLDPRYGGCSVLYTSRLQHLPNVDVEKSCPLDKFSEAEAEELFQRVLGVEQVARHREALFTFAQKVEMLPLAISVGANYLSRMQAMPIPYGIQRLRLESLIDQTRNVPELFRNAIEARPEDEQNLLTACSVCLQEGFWLPLAARIVGLDIDRAIKAASQLAESSLLRLLDRDRQRFHLHAILREQIRASCSTEQLDSLQMGHADALMAVSQDWKEHSAWLFWHEIDQASKFLLDKGESQKALALRKKEEAMWLALDNKDALELNYEGQAIIMQGEHPEEALALLEKQETTIVASGKEEGLLRSYLHQAAILSQMLLRPEKALPLLLKLAPLALKLGSKEPLMLAYQLQGKMLYESGQYTEALSIFGKAEELCLELGNRYQLAWCYGWRAMIADDQSDRETAKRCLKQALAIFTELHKSDESRMIQGLLDDIG